MRTPIKLDSLDEKFSKLLKVAIEARESAYAPYSKYKVGAALLTKSGEIISGSNIENASYGLSICAERVCSFTAVHKGQKEFLGMVVVTKNAASPCGACRQVLNEFNPELQILSSDDTGSELYMYTLDSLLPNSFGPKSL